MKATVLFLSLLCSGAALAQTVPVATAREVDQLFATLEHSGCDFYRNGSWYDAQQASSHLHDKYAYLVDRGRITSTESFIDLAATKSSMSGKPYMVRCGKADPVESRVWFTSELGVLRKRPVAVRNPPKTVP